MLCTSSPLLLSIILSARALCTHSLLNLRVWRGVAHLLAHRPCLRGSLDPVSAGYDLVLTVMPTLPTFSCCADIGEGDILLADRHESIESSVITDDHSSASLSRACAVPHV